MIVVEKPKVFALVKDGRRYTFRPHPQFKDTMLASFSESAPNRRGFINVPVTREEARETWAYLVKHGYEQMFNAR